MFYKVELVCHHEPHLCRCRHNLHTEVNQDDLTANLIKYNPSLLKYLGRTNTITVQSHNNPTEKETKKEGNAEGNREYRSIVQEKGLNFILKDNFVSQNNNPTNKPTSPRQQPPIQSPKAQTNPPPHQNQPNNIPSSDNNPKSPKNIKQIPESQRHKQVKDFHKDLRNQSRYLSNTAFRKYFDRQCFENYGSQNVHHKGDGFVYGNYLKTYNINPHTGNNMPNNEETFYHALVSASPEKYALQTQEVKLGHTTKTQKSLQKERQAEGHSLEKEKINVEQMLEDNLKHSKLEKKYEHIKIKPGTATQTRKGIISNMKSQGKPTIKPIITSQVSPSPQSPKNQLPLQSRKYIPDYPSQQLEGKTEKETPKHHQTAKIDHKAESIMVEVVQPSKAGPPESSPVPHCGHQPGEQTSECECCLNQMKGLILSLAESDPDLASRIVASAKKATLYKNFALNNYVQAAMNPHNYTNNGRLNVYRH